jgi:hypothetical protein
MIGDVASGAHRQALADALGGDPGGLSIFDVIYSARAAGVDIDQVRDNIDARFNDAHETAWRRSYNGVFGTFGDGGGTGIPSAPGEVTADGVPYAVTRCDEALTCLTCGWETEDWGDAAEEAHRRYDGAHHFSSVGQH